MKISNKTKALLKVWESVHKHSHEFARKNGYSMVHPLPSIMSSAGSCENFLAVFELSDSEEYFGQKAFLVQSLQLLLEMFTSELGGKVYTEIRSFRKEKEADNRRLTEFPLFEIEQNSSFDGLVETGDKLIRNICKNVAIDCEKELELFGRDWKSLLDLHFKRITYIQALEYLKNLGFKVNFGDDLTSVHELAIVKNLGDGVVITHYPKEIKFWNMRENKDDPRLVDSFDFILSKSGESMGAASRETNYDKLVEKLKTSEMYKLMKERNVPDSAFDWYLDHHKENNVKEHAGFGLGVARLVQFILNQDDIRDVMPFVNNKENLL